VRRTGLFREHEGIYIGRASGAGDLMALENRAEKRKKKELWGGAT